MTTCEDKRAAHIASLRALADLLEREPSLPIPYLMDGTGYTSHAAVSKPEQVGAVFAAAKLLGVDVEHDRVHGVVRATLSRDAVRYCVYAKVGPCPVPDDTVTVADPSQVLGAAAVSV